MIENPIITIEWAEETHFQLGAGWIDNLRASARIVDGAVWLAAAVQDIDAAIVAQAVVGRDAGAALLEALFIARNFIPATQIGLQGYRLGGFRDSPVVG